MTVANEESQQNIVEQTVKENTESKVVEQTVEVKVETTDALNAEQEIKTVEEGIKNIAEALMILENEVKAEQVRS